MATYPSSIVSFATHNSGDIVQPGDVNTPNAEIVAVETGLLSGFQHDLLPLSDDSRSLGSVSHRWLKAWLQDIDSDGTATLTTVNVSSNLTPASLVDISGAGAGQVKFPASQNASANANTLDDYAEGTWTPSVGGSATYTTQIGGYTKIGNLVFVRGEIVINSIGTGSTTTISGLPFTAGAASVYQPISVGLFTSIASSVVWLGGYADAGTTNIILQSTLAAGGSVGSNAIFQNAARVVFSGTYRTGA